MSEKIISIPENIDITAVFGSMDENIKIVEKIFSVKKLRYLKITSVLNVSTIDNISAVLAALVPLLRSIIRPAR